MFHASSVGQHSRACVLMDERPEGRVLGWRIGTNYSFKRSRGALKLLAEVIAAPCGGFAHLERRPKS
jgi:hypothetical protein